MDCAASNMHAILQSHRYPLKNYQQQGGPEPRMAPNVAPSAYPLPLVFVCCVTVSACECVFRLLQRASEPLVFLT